MAEAHSPPRRGGECDSLIEAGAPGAKREPDRAKPQLMVSSAKRCAGLTTPTAPLRWLRGILLMAQPPLCEEGNITRPELCSTVLSIRLSGSRGVQM